jgi:trehalose-6-phosphate synthase
MWEAYVAVNQTFADAVRDACMGGRTVLGGTPIDTGAGNSGVAAASGTAISNAAIGRDLIFIHDHPLLLAPAMLRTAMPHATIGYFWHLPFPSSELFRVLTQRERLLQGGKRFVLLCDY